LDNFGKDWNKSMKPEKSRILCTIAKKAEDDEDDMDKYLTQTIFNTI